MILLFGYVHQCTCYQNNNCQNKNRYPNILICLIECYSFFFFAHNITSENAYKLSYVFFVLLSYKMPHNGYILEFFSPPFLTSACAFHPEHSLHLLCPTKGLYSNVVILLQHKQNLIVFGILCFFPAHVMCFLSFKVFLPILTSLHHLSLLPLLLSFLLLLFCYSSLPQSPLIRPSSQHQLHLFCIEYRMANAILISPGPVFRHIPNSTSSISV